MRILMMIHRLADNSPYCFYVHEQAKALREQGHDVTVISCVGTMPMMKRLRPALAQTDKRTPKADVIDGIPVYFPRCLTLGNAGEKLLGGYPMYRAALPIARKLHDETPFDVIHAHMLPREGHAGRLLGRALGVPVALTVHGTDVFHYFIPGQTPWKRNIETAQNVDALMAVSSLLLSRVAPYRGEGKISRVVQNGVDLSLVPENEARRPRSVISVGTLKARKCMDKTLEAFARLADEYEDATLTIVGIGEMEAQLKARIAELRSARERDADGRFAARRSAAADGAERLVRSAQLGRGIRHCLHRGDGGGLHRRRRGKRGYCRHHHGRRERLSCARPPTRTRWKRSCALCSPIQKRMKRCGREARATRAD